MAEKMEIHVPSLPICYADDQSERIAKNYFDSLCWLLDQQNRDGSWGRDWPSQVTYTAHGVQLLTQAGFLKQDYRLAKAISWLKKKATEKASNKYGLGFEWIQRIPALIAAGETEWLLKTGEIDRFLDYYHNRKDKIYGKSTHDDDVDLFFWYIVPVMLALKQAEHEAARRGSEVAGKVAERNIPYKEVAKQLEEHEEWSSRDQIKVANKANHTGLAALYLYTIDKDQHRDRIDGMKNCLAVLAEGTTVIRWNDSIGSTAYVLIDFAAMNLLTDRKIRKLVQSGLRYFKPTPDGHMPPDQKLGSRAYDTTMHKDVTYTTLVALRAMAMVMGNRDCVMRSATAIATNRYLDQSLREKIRFLKRFRKRRIPKYLYKLMLSFYAFGFVVTATMCIIFIALDEDEAFQLTLTFFLVFVTLLLGGFVFPKFKELAEA